MPPAFADACVQRGEDALAALAAAVTALYEHPAYRRLAGDATTPGCPLTGASRQAADAAVAAVRGLLADYEVCASAAPAELPADVAQRCPAAQASLDRFANAWTHFPHLAPTGQEQCRALLERAEALPAVEVATELAACSARLAGLTSAFEFDPLDAHSVLQHELTTTLPRLRAALESAGREKAELGERLAAAALRARDLRSAHAAALETVRARDARILDPAAPPLPTDSLLRALFDWCEKLAHSATTAHWPAAARALGAWEQRAAECEEQIRTALARAEADLTERRQLRGWLRALQAKAGALRQAEEPRFSAAALEAHRLLHSRPTPLARVRSLLSTCQTLLTHAH